MSELTELYNIAGRISDILRGRKETVGVAESSAAGLISTALLAVPGASRYYQGGAVCYTRPSKIEFLDLPVPMLESIRSSSEPHAEMMAKAVSEQLGATWGLAETGAAGPGGNRYGDNAGHTCIAVFGPVMKVMTLETEIDDRQENMLRFAKSSLEFFERCIDY